tara:strand:+ start:3593 stop:5245 length:1653 start_codon:yes stop_codon:yes gene_type:complete
MAKEVLEMEVKTNIGKVTKDQKDFNKELKKTEGIIEDVNSEGKETVAEMQILGLSINGLKASWKSAASGAKFLFKSVKMGIASTGVGILLLAFGALATWFAKTKKGAEFLSVAFKGIGAAINVIVDRIAKFGGGLAKILSGNISGGLKDMGNSFKDIGAEIVNDTLLAMALEKSLQRLTDSQRALNVETAQRRADIEELKLIAEDVTKTEKERLDAAEKAFSIETDLLERRIANATEAVRIEKLRLSTVLDPEADALDILAQKEIDLATIRGESVTKQIELNNKINTIKQETINNNKIIADQNAAEIKATQDLNTQLQILRQEDQNAKELIALQNEKIAARETAMLIKDRIERGKQLALIDKIFSLKYLELVDKQFDIEIDGNKKTGDKVLKTDKEIADAKKTMNMQIAQQGLSILASAAGEGTALAKAAAIAQATISGVQGVQNAFTSANANIGATAGSFGAYPVTMAALAGTFAAMNIAKIASGGKPGGGGGGGGGGASAAAPAPQMMSGAFDLTGGVTPEPVQAFVLTDSMTNSQNQLANIRRRATI